jgi:ferritin-like metal-binding protein YciE
MRRRYLLKPSNRRKWCGALGRKIFRERLEGGTQTPRTPLIRGTIWRDTMARKKQKTLQDLFLDTLKDIYYAENKILKALPKMAKAAQARELQAAFKKHLKETEGQVKRLEQIFDEIGETAKGKKCPAIDGIIKEGDEIAKDYKGSPAIDAGLLAAAQAVEHYEISRYGTLKTWAEELGLNGAVGLIDETLSQEKDTDAALSKIAEGSVNDYAKAA